MRPRVQVSPLRPAKKQPALYRLLFCCSRDCGAASGTEPCAAWFGKRARPPPAADAGRGLLPQRSKNARNGEGPKRFSGTARRRAAMRPRVQVSPLRPAKSSLPCAGCFFGFVYSLRGCLKTLCHSERSEESFHESSQKPQRKDPSSLRSSGGQYGKLFETTHFRKKTGRIRQSYSPGFIFHSEFRIFTRIARAGARRRNAPSRSRRRPASCSENS